MPSTRFLDMKIRGVTRIPSRCMALAVSLMLAACSAHVQGDPVAFRIVGRVLESGSAEPLETTQVVILSARVGNISQKDGRFEVSGALLRGTYSLKFSALGYTPTIRAVRIAPGMDLDVGDVYLEPDTAILHALRRMTLCAPPPTSRPGLWIEVRSSRTDSIITAVSRINIEDGSYSEVLHDNKGHTYAAGAFNRPGQYVVRVEAPGYNDWERRDVVVTGDGCGVQTVRLFVGLMPAGHQ